MQVRVLIRANRIATTDITNKPTHGEARAAKINPTRQIPTAANAIVTAENAPSSSSTVFARLGPSALVGRATEPKGCASHNNKRGDTRDRDWASILIVQAATEPEELRL